ncbi:MAG TPA: hypothetical protein VG711_07825 [Phycisphaerales bacterium]|nr:hypothetical protein [Phycisphaerales bacterium]
MLNRLLLILALVLWPSVAGGFAARCNAGEQSVTQCCCGGGGCCKPTACGCDKQNSDEIPAVPVSPSSARLLIEGMTTLRPELDIRTHSSGAIAFSAMEKFVAIDATTRQATLCRWLT